MLTDDDIKKIINSDGKEWIYISGGDCDGQIWLTFEEALKLSERIKQLVEEKAND